MIASKMCPRCRATMSIAYEPFGGEFEACFMCGYRNYGENPNIIEETLQNERQNGISDVSQKEPKDRQFRSKNMVRRYRIK